MGIIHLCHCTTEDTLPARQRPGGGAGEVTRDRTKGNGLKLCGAALDKESGRLKSLGGEEKPG